MEQPVESCPTLCRPGRSERALSTAAACREESPALPPLAPCLGRDCGASPLQPQHLEQGTEISIDPVRAFQHAPQHQPREHLFNWPLAHKMGDQQAASSRTMLE
jgi:hypothetical protein